jgi:hypothetical protein
MSVEEFTIKYEQLAHAIQTGVAYNHNFGSEDGTPKHLRTGVNLIMTDHASLVELLTKKGIITESEYFEAVIEGLNKEVARYEARLQRQLNGTKITLK